MDLSSFQLGKLPHVPKRKDMHLRAYLNRAAAEVDLNAAPAAINWYEMPQPDGALPEFDDDVLGNDHAGDCALAAPAHLTMLDAKLAGSPTLIVTDQVIAEYSALTGYRPSDGTNDNGAYLRDVMDRWRTVGLFGEKIDAYLYVNPRDPVELAWAMWMAGGLIGGFALPLCARDQKDSQGNPDWTIPEGGWPKGEGPGTWGGHAIAMHSTSAGNSWGMFTNWSRDWFETCCDELVMPITKRFQLRNGRTPNGLVYDDVLADARARGAG